MAATDRAAGRQREDTLTICSLGTFAHKCLIPILESFRTLYPKISLRLRTGFPFEQVAPNDSDLSILYGLGDWPGMSSWKIHDEELFPVCSPSLLHGRRALKRPSDLRFHTIIRTSSPLLLRDDWPLWLAEAGIAKASFRDEISCDLLNPTFQLAINGLGVAMGRSGVVQFDLENKLLVEPFDIRLPSALAYYVVVPEARANSPKIQRFVTWLLKEFGRTIDKKIV